MPPRRRRVVAAAEIAKPDVSKYGVTPPNVGPAGGPFATHIPGPVGTVPVQGVVKRSFFR